MKPRMQPDSVVQLNFRQAKLQGVWETFAVGLREQSSQAALVDWYESDATQRLIRTMPDMWHEEAEAAYHAAWDGLGGFTY